jgi:hypothetical protein
VITVVIWGVILAAGAVWGIATGGPTSRDQTTVADALPVVDRATAEIVSAVDADGQGVATIAELSKAADCSISVIRSGQRYQRVVTVYVTPGTEGALLQRLAQRLPASYQASVRTGNAPRLSADAGLYVAVNATVAAPGTIRFVLDTGDCRAPGNIPAESAGEPTPAQRQPVETALGLLRVPAATWHLYQATCSSGGRLTSVEAETAKGAVAGPLNVPLAASSASTRIATPDLVAYTADHVGVVARTAGDTVIVTATTPCT